MLLFERIFGHGSQNCSAFKGNSKSRRNSKVHDQIWISSIDTSEESGEKFGRLTVGYGAGGRDLKVGPELTFGITMQKHLGDNPTHQDLVGRQIFAHGFPSSSAGPYRFNEQELEHFRNGTGFERGKKGEG